MELTSGQTEAAVWSLAGLVRRKSIIAETMVNAKKREY
jgi:hypothetical protein